MPSMLCRNRIHDYATWRAVFDADASAHREAGLILKSVWRKQDDENTVFFLFAIDSIEKANEFINAPGAEDQAKRAGLIDGEYHFLTDAELY